MDDQIQRLQWALQHQESDDSNDEEDHSKYMEALENLKTQRDEVCLWVCVGGVCMGIVCMGACLCCVHCFVVFKYVYIACIHHVCTHLNVYTYAYTPIHTHPIHTPHTYPHTSTPYIPPANKQVREKHRTKLRQHHQQFHLVWGQLLKTGYQNSQLAHQAERFACLYTSHVANLLYYSPDKSYR